MSDMSTVLAPWMCYSPRPVIFASPNAAVQAPGPSCAGIPTGYHLQYFNEYLNVAPAVAPAMASGGEAYGAPLAPPYGAPQGAALGFGLAAAPGPSHAATLGAASTALGVGQRAGCGVTLASSQAATLGTGRTTPPRTTTTPAKGSPNKSATKARTPTRRPIPVATSPRRISKYHCARPT